MGVGGQSDVVFLVDFGLLKQYRDPNTYEHIPAKQTLASPEWLLLPPLTATWAWSLDSMTTWSHSPMFSYVSFMALYLGNICLDHRASSSTNNEQSQGNCAVVFWQSLLLFLNIVTHLALKRFRTTDIYAIFSRVCHHRRV